MVSDKKYSHAPVWALSGGGGSRIRTHGTSRHNGFQDRLLKPLGHPSSMTMLQLLETVSKCLILFKIKEDENFNHRKPFSISRIKIWAWRRYWAKWDVLKLSYLIITIQRQLVKIFVSRNTGLKKVEEELKTVKKCLRLWHKIGQTFTHFRRLYSKKKHLVRVWQDALGTELN